MRKSLYIFVPGVLAFCFMMWLSSATRLSYDDLLFAACFKTKGFWGAFLHLYHTHAFRWTTFLFEGFVLGIVPAQYFPISITLFFLVFYVWWIYCLQKLIQSLWHRYFNYSVPTLQSVGLASLIICTFYFSASQAVESFTSVIVVTDRLLPMLFLTMAINLFLSDKKGPIIMVAIAFLALLIAGTAENVTITILAALVLYFCYQKLLLKKKMPLKPVLFGSTLIFFFCFEAFSEGGAARFEVEKIYHFTCGTDGVYCPNNLLDFMARYFIARQLLIFAIIPIFFTFSVGLPEDVKNKIRSSLHRVLIFILILCVPVAVFHFMAAWRVFDCYGPMRMWLPVNFLMALFFVCLAFRFGTQMPQKTNFLTWLSSGLTCALIVFYTVRHYPETSTYTKAYDDRVTSLLSIRDAASIIEVPALPPSGLVVHGDIMENEKDDVNRDFKDTYCLPFDVRRK